MISKRHLQLIRGNSIQSASYIGRAGEISLNSENWTIAAHDGVTPGGYPVSIDNTVIFTAINQTNSNVITANTAMKGYVDGQVSTLSNAPTINSGATVNGNLVVNGNVILNGSATLLNSNNLIVNDNIIYMANNNPDNSLDIGFLGHFTTSSYQHTGLIRQASSESWKLFSNVSAEPGNTIDFTNAVYDNLQVGNVTTPSVVITDTFDALTKTTTVEGWAYSGKSFLVTGQESGSLQHGLHFSPDGINMYIVGQTADAVFQYILSTAWDVSTASYSGKSVSVVAQDTASTSIRFSLNGLEFYILAGTNNAVYQYSLSTAWDVSTASYSGKSVSVVAQDTASQGLDFSLDGTTMYVTGATTDAIYQYTLSTAWDVSTASYANKSLSIAAYEITSTGIMFANNGNKLFLTGTTSDKITEFTLGTAWDVTTATFVDFVGVSQVGTIAATAPRDIFVNFANSVAYILDAVTGRVFQWTIKQSLKITGNKFVVAPPSVFKDNINVFGISRFALGADFDNTVTIAGTTYCAGTLSAVSTVSLVGATTSATSLGTSATTGTTTIGGTAQTGTITIGRSTATQVLNLGTGATAYPSVKTINIGTSGVPGSTTNVIIGSSFTGSLGIIVLNHPTQLKGYTVSTLPAAGIVGRIAYVTDAVTPTYLGALTGGGSVKCPVFDNGTSWVSH